MKQYASTAAMQAEYERLLNLPEECMSFEDMLELEDLSCVLCFNMTPEDVIADRIEDSKQIIMEGFYD